MSTREAEAEEAEGNRRLRKLLGVGVAPASVEGAEQGDGVAAGEQEWEALRDGDGVAESALLPGKAVRCHHVGTCSWSSVVYVGKQQKHGNKASV